MTHFWVGAEVSLMKATEENIGEILMKGFAWQRNSSSNYGEKSHSTFVIWYRSV